jgi:hypothetical protein
MRSLPPDEPAARSAQQPVSVRVELTCLLCGELAGILEKINVSFGRAPQVVCTTTGVNSPVGAAAASLSPAAMPGNNEPRCRLTDRDPHGPIQVLPTPSSP